MSTTVLIPMNEEQRIALEDCFIDEANKDASGFIFDQIKSACLDAKRCVRDNITPVNQRQEDGSPKQEEYPLKGIKLDDYTLEDNTNWLPKNLDKEDSKPIIMKFGDDTMKYLKIFGQLVIIRHEQYNIYEDKYMETQKEEMKEKISDPKAFERFEKSQQNQREARLEQVPTCLQHAIHTSIWPAINNKINANDGKIFDKEHKEIYAEKKDEKPKPVVK